MEIPKPLTKLGKRKKNTRGEKSRKKTPTLVFLISQLPKSIRQIILIGRNGSNQTQARSLAEIVIQKPLCK